MKIAVYTIALNEAQFVERWFQSAKAADYLLIADTGSTDMTVKYAKNLGINVINIAIKPWRFDDARNAALAALPGDVTYAIALDMDEILIDGWREALEAVDATVTRPRYKYTWSWKEDGTEGTHNETGSKREQREDEGRTFIQTAEELLRDDGGQ